MLFMLFIRAVTRPVGMSACVQGGGLGRQIAKWGPLVIVFAVLLAGGRAKRN